jgi:hypothetical protein
MAPGHGRLLVAAISIAALGAIAIFPAAPAVAKKRKPGLGRLITRQATANAPTVQSRSVSAIATCPRRSRVVSGGFKIAQGASGGLTAFESRRIGTRQWRASAVQATNMPLPATLTSFAYCRKHSPKIAAIPATGIVPNDGTGSATASCPAGRKAIAGGFATEVAFDADMLAIPLTSMRVAPRSWVVTGLGTGGNPATVSSYAYCARRIPKLRERRTAVPPPVLAVDTSAGSALCPKPPQARAGGFEVSNQAMSPLIGIRSSYRAGRSWQVIAKNFGAVLATVDAIAYCP